MTLKVAAIQMNAGGDKAKNLARAVQLVAVAAEHGAEFIALPEVFNFRGSVTSLGALGRIAEPIPGPSTRPLMALAARKRVYVLAGSILERSRGRRAYNSSALIGPRGTILEKYRKIHLFDARIGRRSVRESRLIMEGRRSAMVNVRGFRIGLSICYDLRFPEFYGKYASSGASVLCVPSSFTRKTGKAHWETLLRARAIENLCYVIAPNQIGVDGKGIVTYGNSMIVDPWGNILARASASKEQVIYAVLEKLVINRAMRILPSLRVK